MSRVFFTDLRTTPNRNLLDKVGDLLNRAGIDKKIKKNDLVAVKLHFGELGNTAYLRPVIVRRIIERITATGAQPFLTDANTLYSGSRSNAVSHLMTAIHNGFGFSSVGCPLIIADGLRGTAGRRVKIDGEILKDVSISGAILDADALVTLTHFKAHELSGFGGSIKNIGMGCATRQGKLVQHSTVAPVVNGVKCKGCKLCTEYCSKTAISMRQGKAFISRRKCIGCGECIVICPFKAIEIQWNESPEVFQKKMAEYAAGALKGKERKTLFINFVVQVSPACDCYPNSDAPIVRDIGVLASEDPVAVDAASCALVNAEPSLPGTAIKKVLGAGDDKWRALYPSIDWNIHLAHAEKLGLGSREYRLVKI
jgi:uncharacterized protein